MKKIILFLFITNLLLSQENNGIVTYKATPVEKNSELEKMLLSNSPNLYQKIKLFDFTLSFADEKSIFEINKDFENDFSTETSFAKMKCGYLGEIYKIKDTVYKINSSPYLGINLILKKTKISDWVLINETKIIDTYTCYKATTEDIIVNEKGTFNHPITAWYCPTLNYSFGPLGYDGLPGLILELQTKDAVYGASKIDLNLKEEIVFPDISKGKIITETELSNLIKEYRESIRNEK